MKLASTISWSTLATLLKLATGFISIKFIAVLIGPHGVALIGQFQNFTSIIMTIALGGISAGVIKYTSEFKDDPEELFQIWHTISWISGMLLLPTIIVLLIMHNYLATELLGDVKYGSIFVIFAVSLIFYIINSLILNILNGLHQIKKFTILNMLNSIFGLMVSISLVYSFKIYGAILAIVLNQSVVFCVLIGGVINEKWFKLKNFFGKFNRDYFIKLLGFTGMSLVSVCVLPTGQMFVRAYLAKHTTWDIAGCWQGMQSLSNAYLSIVYTGLGTYYLPKLANLQDTPTIRKEIISGYKLIMPFVLSSCLIIYLCRNFIIQLLFSKAFSSMSGMFAWQLTGDCFKIASWILAYLMIAKAKIKLFIFTEIVFGIAFIVLSLVFINLFGANGSVIAFCLNYALYFVVFVGLYLKGYLL